LDGDEVANEFEVMGASVGDRLNEVEALGVRMARSSPDENEMIHEGASVVQAGRHVLPARRFGPSRRPIKSTAFTRGDHHDVAEAVAGSTSE
jgi:hypothetical protein